MELTPCCHVRILGPRYARPRTVRRIGTAVPQLYLKARPNQKPSCRKASRVGRVVHPPAPALGQAELYGTVRVHRQCAITATARPGTGTTCLLAVEVCYGLQQLPEHLLGLWAHAQGVRVKREETV